MWPQDISCYISTLGRLFTTCHCALNNAITFGKNQIRSRKKISYRKPGLFYLNIKLYLCKKGNYVRISARLLASQAHFLRDKIIALVDPWNDSCSPETVWIGEDELQLVVHVEFLADIWCGYINYSLKSRWRHRAFHLKYRNPLKPLTNERSSSFMKIWLIELRSITSTSLESVNNWRHQYLLYPVGVNNCEIKFHESSSKRT